MTPFDRVGRAVENNLRACAMEVCELEDTGILIQGRVHEITETLARESGMSFIECLRIVTNSVNRICRQIVATRSL